MDGGIGRTTARGRCGRVAVLAFKDHVLACQDVMNAARCWARAGYRAEILAFDTGFFPQPALEGEGVWVVAPRTLYGILRSRLRRPAPVPSPAPAPPTTAPPSPAPRSLARHAVSAAGGLLQALQKGEFVAGHALRLVLARRSCVVACDVPSLLAARIARLLRGTPYLYHSRELALSHDTRGWRARLAKAAERHCHRRALFGVIQDSTRAGLLARDNGVSVRDFELVPNAPLGLGTGEPADLLGRIVSLPPGRPVVLYAGTITPDTMVREMIESIDAWPPEPVLVVHGRPEGAYLPELSAAAAGRPGRVLFSDRIVPAEQVDALYAGAAVGLAFYRPIDDNFRHVGLAAGKVFGLMRAGVPVVAGDLPGFAELLDRTGTGVTVRSPAGIGDALRRILPERPAYAARCREVFPRYEFGRHYAAVIRRVEERLPCR